MSTQVTTPDPSILQEKVNQIWAYLQSNPQTKEIPADRLSNWVSYAAGTGQFLTADGTSKSTGQTSVIGVVIWALVSPEVDQRFSSDLEAPMHLEPHDWRSGDIPWIVLCAGPPTIITPMLQRLRTRELAGREIKMRLRDQTGKMVIGKIGADAAA